MRLVPAQPPPGPFRRETWRSPLRGPWLTSVLGLALLAAVPVVFATGLASHAAYNPRLGTNSVTGGRSWLEWWLFSWPTRPSWLYAASQGTHVTLGLAIVPVVLAKLWSVIPRLFEWPPARSPAQALERVTVALLVGGILFELVTGTLNVQVYYPWKFDFVQAHYYGAWLFIAAFVLHVALRLPTVRRALRERGIIEELRLGLTATEAERPGAAGLSDDPIVPANPTEPTVSRRGLLLGVGAASATVAVLYGGQAAGGRARRLALLAPHGGRQGSGPNDFQVNKTAAAVGVDRRATGDAWRLVVVGERTAHLTRAQLLAAGLVSHDLPIACVEGWSTTQRWTGVRLSDLAIMAGMPAPGQLLVSSLQRHGRFRATTFSAGQVADPRSMLALTVNGAALSLDHGFPARIVVPGAPGVHCTKWVQRMEFRA